MKPCLPWIATIATAALAWSAPAAAVTCYMVMDRSDNVVYRSSVPPVDLSDQGAAAREAMRRRGEYLLFGEFESCPGVAFLTGASGSRALSLDDVVNGMPAAAINGGVSPVKGVNPAAAVPPARGPAASAPARRR
jgi:hypothetical protein